MVPAVKKCIATAVWHVRPSMPCLNYSPHKAIRPFSGRFRGCLGRSRVGWALHFFFRAAD